MRPHQWSKNLLLFVPMLLAFQFDRLSLVSALMGFFAFNFICSTVYIINDIADLESDRAHPQKRFRPLAAGEITTNLATAVAGLLLILGSGIALMLSVKFLFALFTYVTLTSLYSWRLKQVPVLDLAILAGLFTLRIQAGALATHTVISFWLIGFSIFWFFNLACVKRVAELLVQKSQSQTHHQVQDTRRGYRPDDYLALTIFGIANVVASVVIIAMFIQAPNVVVPYANRGFIWIHCLLILYWGFYLWLRTLRGEMHHDPVLFALRDPTGYAVGGVFFCALLLARYLSF